MAVRATMSTLITRVRTLISDTGTSPVFTDQQVQDALDRLRVERRWVPLRPIQTFNPGGTITFQDYYADCQQWEDDVLLQDMSFNNVTANADLAEPIVGHWHFPMQPNGIAIRATGKTFDVYGAAADLLDAWAATVKLDFDFTSARDAYQRSQKLDMLRKLAEEYRERALPHMGRIVQGDATSDFDGTGVVYPSIQGGFYG